MHFVHCKAILKGIFLCCAPLEGDPRVHFITFYRQGRHHLLRSHFRLDKQLRLRYHNEWCVLSFMVTLCVINIF